MLCLITGGNGFLGSHVIRMLLSGGHQVIVLKRKNSDLWRLESLLKNLRFYDLDCLELEDVFKQNPGIDVVIHCATAYGRESYGIRSICNSNLMFPVSLLELSIKYNVQSFINSDTFFNTNIPFEQFIAEKRYLEAYILSKRQFQEWGRLICREGKIKFLDIKLEHIYGELDSKTKFVPSLIEKLLANAPQIDLTDGEQSRDFIYIQDVVAAYKTLLDSLGSIFAGYQEFNVGKGSNVKVKEFVQMIKQMTKSTSVLNFGAIKNRDLEIISSQADTKTLAALGWEPKFTDETGIASYLKKLASTC